MILLSVNTSHVIVHQEERMTEEQVKDSVNTSHVIVHQKNRIQML